MKVVKKIIENVERLLFLDGFGESTDVSNGLKGRVSKFIQVTCCSGFDDESLVDTRVRLCKKMKTKSSLTLPPDPNSNYALITS